ncbi:MAG: hypothetical protein ABI779_11840 [Acidobacteriota bacterium]
MSIVPTLHGTAIGARILEAVTNGATAGRRLSARSATTTGSAAMKNVS